jgi:serine acetyltransferase
VIAAGAIVSKDVAPYTIVAGVPAKLIKPRFPANIARRIEALAWWDWEHERLQAALADFRSLSPEAFLEKFGG